jgi:predicted GNAT family acetyltransferase
MARADESDAALLQQWARAFVAETGIPAHDVHGLADRLVAAGGMMLWERGGRPRCMAAVTGDTPNGIRVSYVYTPPGDRGAGYASALVAELSPAQFSAGKKLCFLYTDLTNPTSNGIYRRLGYQQVAESMEVVIEPRGVAAVIR